MAQQSEANGIFTLRDSIFVHAPIDRCFQLTRSIALVHEELGMSAVHGRTAGLVVGGDLVRWEGWQLGLKHFHVSQISGFEEPVFLQDSMLDGRFKTFQHDHHLKEQPDGSTLLQDEVRFSLPFGILGRIVARWIMVPHIRRLLHNRFKRIKRIAECNDWKNYLPQEDSISKPEAVL